MNLKEIYSALGSVEGGEELANKLKEYAKERDELEAKSRIMQKTIDQLGDTDLSELMAVKKYVEGHGGTDALTKTLTELTQKAGAGEAAEKKIADLQSKFQSDLEAERKLAESSRSEIDRLAMENAVQPFFVETYHNGGTVMRMAMMEGAIVKGEKGYCYKDGDALIPLDAGGYEKLKQNENYRPLMKLPSGGGEGGGVGGGGYNKPKSDVPFWKGKTTA